jgi:hypothetical protein
MLEHDLGRRHPGGFAVPTCPRFRVPERRRLVPAARRRPDGAAPGRGNRRPTPLPPTPCCVMVPRDGNPSTRLPSDSRCSRTIRAAFNPVRMRHLVRRGTPCLAAVLLALMSACLPLRRGPAHFDGRSVAVYRTVAESLYLKSTEGRSLALVRQVLDTACEQSQCLPLDQRWGLDSAWWTGDDRPLATRMKDALLARAGRNISFGPRGAGSTHLIVVDSGQVPPLAADTGAWIAFQQRTGAVAALRFSPTAFSRDGKRALVVTQMRCGPRCGHLLAASLELKAQGWALADVLLIASDRTKVTVRPSR